MGRGAAAAPREFDLKEEGEGLDAKLLLAIVVVVVAAGAAGGGGAVALRRRRRAGLDALAARTDRPARARGIGYTIDRECRPRTALGEERVVELANEAREAERRGEGRAVALDGHATDCLGCPANVSSKEEAGGAKAAFGCHLMIWAPLRAEMEAVLLAAGVEALEGAGNPGHAEVAGMLREDPRGTVSHRLRTVDPGFFESSTPREARVVVDDAERTLDTDLMMTLLMTGPMSPEAAGELGEMLRRGIARARREGVGGRRGAAPLAALERHLRGAREAGGRVKVGY